MADEYQDLQDGITTRWLGSSIEYTFLQFLPDYYLSSPGYATWYDDLVDTTAGFQSFTTKQQSAIHFLLEDSTSTVIDGDYADNIDYRVSFSDVIDFTFTEKEQDGNDVGDITFVGVKLNAAIDGQSLLPGAYGAFLAEKGDVLIDKSRLTNADSNIDMGESGFWILLHELGHAFGGLKDLSGTALDQTEFDNQKYTAMSYNTYGDVYASGLGLLDIAALQDTYGTTNTTTRSGNTTYALGQGLGFYGASANDAFLYTIWDGGGTDTIDASGFNVRAEIDLREGHFSSIGKNALSTPTAWNDDSAASSGDPDPGNVAIAYGTVIENAIGTSYDDIFHGVEGLNNAINGGSGSDTIDYSDASVGVSVDLAGEEASEDGDGGTDTLVSIENVRGSDYDDFIAGSDDDNIFYASKGSDYLIGNEGEDTLDGGRGEDTADYSADPDFIEIEGSALTGDLEVIDGWGDTDTLTNIESIIATSGDDIFTFDAPMGLVIDGYGGNDVLTYDDGSFIVKRTPDGGVHAYDQTGSAHDVIYNATVNGLASRIVFDETQEEEEFVYTTDRPVFDYSAVSGPASFVFTPSGGFSLTSPDHYNISYSLSASVTLPTTIEHAGTVASVTDTYEGDAPLLFIKSQASTAFAGTNHGDTFVVDGSGITPVGLVTGDGDDTVFLGTDTFGTVIAYRGGDDVITVEDDLGPFNNIPEINFANGITADMATVDYDGTDLFVEIEGHGTLFVDHFDGSQLDFADGSWITFSVTTPTVHYGSDPEMVVDGSWGADSWTDYSTLDVIYYGYGGNDTINGSAGDSTIYGGDGDDTYVYDGFGGDGVLIDWAGTDVIQVTDSSIHADNLVYEQDGDDLKISFYTSTNLDGTPILDGSMTITGFYGNRDTTINTLRLFDGSSDIDLRNTSFFSSYVIGTSSSDNLSAGPLANSVMFGLDGNDTIFGGAGNDTIYGGDGDDEIFAGDGDNVLDGGEGDNLLSAESGNDTYVLSDTAYSTVSDAGGVNRIITSQMTLSTYDISSGLVLNDDNDDPYAEFTGNFSTITFGDGSVLSVSDLFLNNIVFYEPTSGNDEIAPEENGTYGDFSIDLLDGDDEYRGGISVDIVNGGSGLDVLQGGAGDDILRGGVDIDELSGNEGNDILDGGRDQDTVNYANDFGAASGVTVNLGLGVTTNDGFGNVDTLISIEDVIGSNDDDDITGSTVDNVLYGLDGNDIINGDSGNDTLYGGDGNDTLYGSDGDDYIESGTGSNYLYGGAGNDTLIGNYGTDTVYGGEGDDDITGDGDYLYGEGGNDTFHAGVGYEVVHGNDGLDTFHYDVASTNFIIYRPNSSYLYVEDTVNPGYMVGFGTDWIYNDVEYIHFSDVTLDLTSMTFTLNGAGWGSAVAVTGTGSGETLTGKAAQDHIHGAGGNDTINAGYGDDFLYGDAGDDTLNGGDGSDTADYSNAAAGVTASIGSNAASDDGDGGSDSFSSIENLTGSAYADTLTGNSSANTLIGGAGNDTIYGGGGADTLSGQAGTDTLYGEGGADIFAFEVASAFSNQDVIADFNTGQDDVLDIHNLLVGFDELTSAITDFVSFSTSGSDSIMSVDRDGTSGVYSSQAIATILGLTGLDADDLLDNGHLLAA